MRSKSPFCPYQVTSKQDCSYQSPDVGDFVHRKQSMLFNRQSRVRAVVARASTGLVGQNTSCKAHKVCISLWPMGWDDVRTRADESPV